MEAYVPNVMLLMKVLYLYTDKMLEYLDLYIVFYILMILVSIQDKVKVTMADENSSFEKIVSWSFGQFFNSFNELRCHRITAKLFNEFVIVNLFVVGGCHCVNPNYNTILIVLFNILFHFDLLSFTFLSNFLLFFFLFLFG